MNILSFGDAVVAASSGKRHILLGNGFSIACRPKIFSYKALLEQADFSKAPEARAVFQALETNDFEAVIKLLNGGATLIGVFNGDAKLAAKFKNVANALKEILVRTVAQHHPDRPYSIKPDAYANCRSFLRNFDSYYTLNYDVLLYWALLNDDVDDFSLSKDDGFRDPEVDGAEYVSWLEYHRPNVHYLHGALHLFQDGSELIKYTWSRTDIPIIEQIRSALAAERYPLFVAEGTSRQKMTRIMNSAYLHKAYRSLSSIGGSLYVFGHSLADNDDHIYKAIRNSQVRRLFVSLFGDPSSADNKKIIQRANNVLSRSRGKQIEVQFFDAQSANVWG